jgi:hypothetical protein
MSIEPTKGINCTSVAVAVLCLLAAFGAGYGIEAIRNSLGGWGAAVLAIGIGIALAVCAVLITRALSDNEDRQS